MSFQLPSVKPKPENSNVANVNAEGIYGVPDVMTSGLAATKAVTNVSHPVMQAEINYVKNRDQMNMAILRNTQGLHAPLRIQMELKACKQIGHLPFLASSNVMHDVLTGKDLEIGFEDILNTPEFREEMGQPHAVCERRLGLL